MATLTTTEVVSDPSSGTSRTYIPGATYILPVDRPEVERLELQHKCIKAAYGGKLLLAPHDKDGSYMILESASGTGAWLLELASQLSQSVILHGTDLDGNRFPKDRPSNLSFSTGSILSLPPSWTGKFDFVHQRLLMCGLKREEWPKAVNEMHRVLAPGGWAQLGEYGPWGLGPAMDAYMRIYSLLYKHNGIVLRAYAELEDWMREAGFTNIQVIRNTYPLGSWAGELGKDGAENLWTHFRALKEQVLRTGGFGLVRDEKELDGLINAVRKEWDESNGSVAEFVYVIGQKPNDI